MTYPLRILSDVTVELENIAAAYGEIRSELALKFTHSVDESLKRITEYPKLYGRVAKNARRVSVRGFPYRLYYRFDENEVVVFAAVHTARDPSVWKSRLI